MAKAASQDHIVYHTRNTATTGIISLKRNKQMKAKNQKPKKRVTLKDCHKAECESFVRTLTIDIKYSQRIENIRKFKEASDALLDDLIDELGSEMNLKTEIENDILWDHVMNESDWNVEYKASSK